MADCALGILRGMPPVCGELACDDPGAAGGSSHCGCEAGIGDADASAAACAGVAAAAGTCVGDFDLLRGGNGVYRPDHGRALDRAGVGGAAGADCRAGVGDPICRWLFHAGSSGWDSPAGTGDAFGGSRSALTGLIEVTSHCDMAEQESNWTEMNSGGWYAGQE